MEDILIGILRLIIGIPLLCLGVVLLGMFLADPLGAIKNFFVAIGDIISGTKWAINALIDALRHKLSPKTVSRYYELIANNYAFRYYVYKKGGRYFLSDNIPLSRNELWMPYSAEEIKKKDKGSRSRPYQEKADLVKKLEQAERLFAQDFRCQVLDNELYTKYYSNFGVKLKIQGEALKFYCLIYKNDFDKYIISRETELKGGDAYRYLHENYPEALRLLSTDKNTFLRSIYTSSFRSSYPRINGLKKYDEELLKYINRVKDLDSHYWRYKKLKQQYPIGVEVYEREQGANKSEVELIELVVDNENTIALYEKNAPLANYLSKVVTSQHEFTEALPWTVGQSCKHLIPLHALDNKGNYKLLEYEVKQKYVDSYSENPEIVSSLNPEWEEVYESVSMLIQKKKHTRYLLSSIGLPSSPITIAKATGKEDTHVLFVEHGEITKDVNDYQFDWLKKELDAEKISYEDFGSNAPNKVCNNYILIDLVTTHSDIINKKCSQLLGYRRNLPITSETPVCNIVYFSCIKAFTQDEAMAIVREEREEIRAYLQRNNIKYLYHFTAKKNIAKIKALGGLYSWAEMERRGEAILAPGGNDTSRKKDVQHGIEDYVHLCFCSDHPMRHQLELSGNDMIVLQIDIAAAMLNGVMFSNMNTMYNEHKKYLGIRGLHEVKLPITQRKYNEIAHEDFKYHQAEILIPKHLPIKYITGAEYL